MTVFARPASPRSSTSIRDYNRDDCLSTLLLRDWLIERAKEAGRWPPAPSR